MTVICSDVSGTSIISTIAAGGTIYVGGSILTNIAGSGLTKIEIRDTSTDTLATGGTILNTTYTYSSGTAATYATISGGLPYPTWDGTGYSNIEMYAKAIVSGATITEATDYEYFKVLASPTTPTISSQQLSDYTITTSEHTNASCVVSNDPVVVGVRVNNEDFRLPLSGGSTYYAQVKGCEVGTVTNGSVLFYAAKDTQGDTAAAGTLMTISSATISEATIISDITKFFRDQLKSNLTICTNVKTSWPSRQATYPIITVQGSMEGDADLGTANNDKYMELGVSVRIWARNTRDRDRIWDDLYSWLRKNQATTQNSDLYHFKILEGPTDIDEPGEHGLHSREVKFGYNYIAT